jgi:hypothetical protein
MVGAQRKPKLYNSALMDRSHRVKGQPPIGNIQDNGAAIGLQMDVRERFRVCSVGRAAVGSDDGGFAGIGATHLRKLVEIEIFGHTYPRRLATQIPSLATGKIEYLGNAVPYIQYRR